MRIPRSSFTCLLFMALCGAAPLSAQSRDAGTVVVTATRHETALRSVSTTATVITAEQIRQRGLTSVADVLRDELSIDVAQSGGPGGLSYTQIRGLPGKYMVVLIDGVRVNDPADPNGGPGTIFSHMTTDDIERIEVIRGAKSPLYGSNAATGVINIITRRGSGDGQLEFSYEGGSLASNRLDFGYSVAQKGWALRADQNITATDGVIARESYRNLTTSVKLGYQGSGGFEWESVVRYTNAGQHFHEFVENYGGPAWTVQLPDPNQKSEFGYTTVGTRITNSILDNWRQEINFGLGRRNRETDDPDDGLLGYMSAPYDGFTLDYANYYDLGLSVPVYDGAWGSYSYTGTNYDIDYRHTATFESDKTSDIISTGFEYLYRDYKQAGAYGDWTNNVGNVAGYVHNQTLLLQDALSINLGARYDDHQRAGGAATGSAGAAYDIRRVGLVLRASYGSAFRAPAVYELLFESPYGMGNPDLEPEKSRSWEIGFEKYSWEGKFRLTASTWHTKIDNAIIYVTDPDTYLGTYKNADRAESDGVEVGIKLAPLTDWHFALNYTYTDSRHYSAATGVTSRRVQVPYHKFNLNATWLYRGCSLNADGYWVDSSRLRWNETDYMGGYFRLDLTGRAPVYKRLELSVRAVNLLDKNYWESYGIREAGTTVYAGLRVIY